MTHSWAAHEAVAAEVERTGDRIRLLTAIMAATGIVYSAEREVWLVPAEAGSSEHSTLAQALQHYSTLSHA